jgi:hypothetical protein
MVCESLAGLCVSLCAGFIVSLLDCLHRRIACNLLIKTNSRNGGINGRFERSRMAGARLGISLGNQVHCGKRSLGDGWGSCRHRGANCLHPMRALAPLKISSW